MKKARLVRITARYTPAMRLALLILLSLLVLPAPARGQTTEEIDKLIAELGDGDKGVRASAATALGAIGPKAVPALIEALSNESKWVRRKAAIALADMGAKAASAVHALAAAHSDEDELVCTFATIALGQIGPEALPAVPALIRGLSSKNLRHRVLAAQALAKIGPTASPALIAALSDKDAQVRAWTAYALGKIGPAAAAAVPALTEALFDEHGAVRGSAAEALGTIGVDRRGLLWVVPAVYKGTIVGLLAALAAWFALLTRFPKHRPASTRKHVALVALTAAVPVALACSTVLYAITRPWTQGFLPDTLTLVPFPVAAVLSTALVVTLPAIWVCQRKSVAPEADAGLPQTEAEGH